MADKFVGILGGMGPDATVTMFHNILRATPAVQDQDHLRILIYNHPKLPDRTAAICDDGASPLPELITAARLLEHAGVDLLAIPCVTAHYFYDGIQKALTIPVLHIVKEILQYAAAHHSECQILGLLSTLATMRTGLFQHFSGEFGQTILMPSEDLNQTSIMAAIYKVKAGTLHGEPTRLLQHAANTLIEQGASAIIAGCTEIPLALSPQDISVPLLDPLKILAQAVVREAKGN